ncbi:hypothetical protein SGUI_0701 [Serinicoccus hydrothermalis]|uniref:DUF429 domain-containing protein n=1 Tax=Serinicoccus hydrothermalis TaxID=1758689 RepID=A0A1B1N9J1_9MICO|nr:DUF429 domain-containing protein [Serinicoccus hydrothermalis]ANS78097.1 hypothetical protein SGUI_0701 [Serinicoccus hydrothermalis]
MFVGIDLAWNDRARTGLAAVDDEGRLLGSATCRSDEEIDEWLRAYPSPDVVAIDAPLIVHNPTGQRPCERMVTSAFGRFDAGCHASNTSKAYMNPPRAARLAQRQGWAPNPSATGPGVCLEVYPHPAMVGLFGLGRILPYKGKRGRSLDVRRAAMVELLDRIEGLGDLDLSGSVRWREIRYAVEHATRPMHLEHVEDEIDAIFCAHLARVWRHSPGALQVYGDVESGYIVAPPAPSHAATPRPGRVSRTSAG